MTKKPKYFCISCKHLDPSLYKDSLYCEKCSLIVEKRGKELTEMKKIFDETLDACINTPPLKLKELKERLKKEREESRK